MTPPFAEAVELDHSLANWHPKKPQPQPQALPSHPRIDIADEDTVVEFLNTDLLCEDLDALEPYLWTITTASAANITPLHAQQLRGRRVVLTEDPGMHLVWRRHEIFIKPIPEYLLCHAFWARFLAQQTAPKPTHQREIISRAAQGYLRTYAYLIRYQSDFRVAQREDLQLVPKDISWEDFNRFIAAFEHLDQRNVSPRYKRYGELRLSRLSGLIKVLFIRWTYRYTTGDYGDYFERFFGPLLFIFAILSIMLNAMQVTLAVESIHSLDWVSFWTVSRWFAVATLLFSVVLGCLMGLLLMRKILGEWVYAVKHRLKQMFR